MKCRIYYSGLRSFSFLNTAVIFLGIRIMQKLGQEHLPPLGYAACETAMLANILASYMLKRLQISFILFIFTLTFNMVVCASGEERSVEFLRSIEEVEGYLTMMRESLPSASCSEAKVILSGYLDVLEKYKDNENTIFSGKVFYGDKVVTMTRVANVVEAEGVLSEANRYRVEAKAACLEAQWSSCSAATIDRVVLAMDQELKIGCLQGADP